uniref:Uncharacterized protein n=1 Tax=Romanomermis culicivorax TaxID=13658 RepID=A0A915IM98_ROMCU
MSKISSISNIVLFGALTVERFAPQNLLNNKINITLVQSLQKQVRLSRSGSGFKWSDPDPRVDPCLSRTFHGQHRRVAD